MPVAALLGLLAAVWGPAGQAADLDAAERLVASGAPGLALAVLAEEPPQAGQAAWPRWARLRLRALEAQGRWRRVVQLADDTPQAAPTAYRQWAAMRAARLELAHDRPAAARRRVARLVAAHPEDGRVRAWLELVYRGYAGEGRLDDARVAVLRHRQGRGPQEQDLTPAGELTQARILARSGARQEALAALGDQPAGPKRRQLRVRLLLESGARDQALTEARTWANGTTGREARLAWEAVAEAAGELGRLPLRVRALERVLAPATRVGEQRVVRVERTWEAYLRRGEYLGNEAGLLVGDDTKWLELARTADSGVDQRALLASVALLGRTPGARETARLALVDALAEAGLPGTAIRLFAEGPAFQDPGSLGPRPLVELAQLALAEKRYATALTWMDRVDRPPGAMDAGTWLLTRARLRIQLGDFAGGAADVETLLGDPDRLSDGDFRDRLLQVLFDLQEAEQHATALRLFRGVYQAVADPGARRELLFWMAESRQALGAHREAATLYLRSAAHPAGEMGDPWSRTARFRAAKALQETAYTADARRLFQQLLGTGSSRQDLAIQRHLRRLEGGEGQ